MVTSKKFVFRMKTAPVVVKLDSKLKCESLITSYFFTHDLCSSLIKEVNN